MSDLNNSEVPTAPTAEHSLLGAVLLDPLLLSEFDLDHVPPEAFYSEKHRTIWKELLLMYWQDTPIDTATLVERLRSQGKLEDSGGVMFIAGLMEYEGVGINALQYATDVMESHQKRRIMYACGNAIRRARSATQAEDIISSLEADLQMLHGSHRDELKQADVLATDFIENRKGSRIQTGFPSVDDVTGGLPVGDLTTLAGRLSMGKSAFAHHVAFNVDDTHVLTPDQPLPEILINEACRRSRVPYGLIRRQRVTEEQKAAWKVEYDRVRAQCEENVTFDPRALTVTRLRTEVRRAARSGKKLIVVDSLQAIRSEDTSDRRHTMVEVTGALKDLARDQGVAILALSQISRAVEQRESRVPQLSDLSESKTIEDDSNLVLLLYRKGYYYPDEYDSNLATVIVGKNKTGPRLSSATLLFDGEYIEFREPLGQAPAPSSSMRYEPA